MMCITFMESSSSVRRFSLKSSPARVNDYRSILAACRSFHRMLRIEAKKFATGYRNDCVEVNEQARTVRRQQADIEGVKRMTSIRILAAAILASSGLVLTTPALAAPKSDTAAAPWAGAVVQVKDRSRDRNWTRDDRNEEWRKRDGHRDGDRTRRSDRDWRHDGDRTRRSDRDWRRDDRRHGDRKWHRDDRRYGHGDRNWRRDHKTNRGKHYGWDRGKHYGWDKGKKRKHWRARHHPRHNYWIGRRMPRNNYVRIDDYDNYYLPQPRRGSYYARVDNDIFEMSSATDRILNAFVLDALRY
jgi:pre-mRNA-splicing factor 38A